jgi:hypothetical protein
MIPTAAAGGHSGTTAYAPFVQPNDDDNDTYSSTAPFGTVNVGSAAQNISQPPNPNDPQDDQIGRAIMQSLEFPKGRHRVPERKINTRCESCSKVKHKVSSSVLSSGNTVHDYICIVEKSLLTLKI